MLRYFIRRIVWIVPVFLGVTLITSIFMQLLPGDPFTSDKIPKATRDQIRHVYGLDQPWYIQYFIYVTNFLRGDWGTSFQQIGRPVTVIIWEHIGYSLTLAVIAI